MRFFFDHYRNMLRIHKLTLQGVATTKTEASGKALITWLEFLDDQMPPQLFPQVGGSSRHAVADESEPRAIEEDTLADPGLVNGLRESVGQEAIDVFGAVRLDLEEEDAAREDHAEHTQNQEEHEAPAHDADADSDSHPEAPAANGADIGAAGPAIEPGALGGARTEEINGVVVFFTGFVGGAIARLHLRPPPPDAPASSNAAPRGARLGVLEKINDQDLKTTCNLHKYCSCWVSVRGRSMAELLRDLTHWVSLANPAGDARSGEAHSDAARVSKLRYGMRVRKEKD